MPEVVSVREAVRQLGLDGVLPQGMRRVLDQAQVHSFRQLCDKAKASKELPSRLQLRLLNFTENESSDDFLQGSGDEVYLSAIGTDSATVVLGSDGKPTVAMITTQPIGDVSDESVRGPWREHPHVLLEFDLRRPSDWPRSFNVTVLIVESDNGEIADSFAALEKEVGETVKIAVTTAASVGSGALAGAAVGSFIPLPGIGTAVGAAVGAIAGAAYDGVIEKIKEGLGDDAFPPQAIGIVVLGPAEIRQHPQIGGPQNLLIDARGASYVLEYDWRLAD